MFRNLCCCAESGSGMPYESTVPMLDEEPATADVRFTQKQEDTPATPRVARSSSLEVNGSSETPSADADKAEAPEFPAPLPAAMHASTAAASTKMDSEQDFDEKIWVINCNKGRKEEGLGLDIMIDKNQKLTVSAHPTKPGAILEWNRSHPDQAVIAGDIIESVNGAVGKEKILEAMKNSYELTLRMRRVIRCEVVVPCTSEGNLGLELRESGNALLVERILEDCDVKKANSRCLAGKQIAVGNLILKVNGVGGDAEDMVHRLQNAKGDVFLSIYRPFVTRIGM